VARRGEGSEEKTTDAKTMLATLDTTQLSSVLAGLDAGVELADITAEVRRRLAAGGGGDAAGAPVAKIQEKKKKKKKSKKEKKISKKEKKDK
jgi:ribosomal protein L12E/L44/L45/RPP1/RPP2